MELVAINPQISLLVGAPSTVLGRTLARGDMHFGNFPKIINFIFKIYLKIVLLIKTPLSVPAST